MRFVFTVPDGIGDFVVRQPMFAALAAKGHSLALVIRSYSVPLAPLIAPQAELFPVHGNPYADGPAKMEDELTPIVEELRSWKPDVVVASPFQRTFLDEFIADRLSPIPSAGMSGILYPGAIEYGHNYTTGIHLTEQAVVREEDSEVTKHQALCRVLLAEPVRLPKPALSIPAELTAAAIEWLAQAGISERPFLAVCAGSNHETKIRNWRPSQWALFAKTAVDKFGLPLLFFGTPDENEFVLEILALMGGAAERSVNVCHTPPPLGLLPAILAQSKAYVGRDTGPMHIAAAVNRPVLAVFGGGTWPRCVPAADRGAVVTYGVPCSGCGWNCHFDEGHCVKDVPVEPMIQHLKRILAGEGGFETVVIEPDMTSLQKLGREAATVARSRLRRLNGELIPLRAAFQAAQAGDNGLQGMVLELQQRLQERFADSAAVGEELRRANERLCSAQEELEQRTQNAVALREQLLQANEQLRLADRQREQRAAEINRLRQTVQGIRGSVFTRLLVALRIWPVFRTNGLVNRR